MEIYTRWEGRETGTEEKVGEKKAINVFCARVCVSVIQYP